MIPPLRAEGEAIPYVGFVRLLLSSKRSGILGAALDRVGRKSGLAMTAPARAGITMARKVVDA